MGALGIPDKNARVATSPAALLATGAHPERPGAAYFHRHLFNLVAPTRPHRERAVLTFSGPWSNATVVSSYGHPLPKTNNAAVELHLSRRSPNPLSLK